jgi:hypothetical protein
MINYSAPLKPALNKIQSRHQGIEWAEVEAKLLANPDALKTLDGMERTGGQPDVIGQDKDAGAFDLLRLFPREPRRPAEPLLRPGGLGRAQGEQAQQAMRWKRRRPWASSCFPRRSTGNCSGLGEFDLKTSSWVKTPEGVRTLGGALFCDRRYGQVFVYHNGAESYYGARGFRGMVKV